MLGYGLTVLGTNLVNWILNGADKILVGRIFPAYTVGLYTTAFNLVNSPSSALYGNLQSVVFSACARLQDNHDALREVFLRLLSVITLVSFPLFVIVGIGSEVVITAFYGDAWLEAAQIFDAFRISNAFFTGMGHLDSDPLEFRPHETGTMAATSDGISMVGCALRRSKFAC